MKNQNSRKDFQEKPTSSTTDDRWPLLQGKSLVTDAPWGISKVWLKRIIEIILNIYPPPALSTRLYVMWCNIYIGFCFCSFYVMTSFNASPIKQKGDAEPALRQTTSLQPNKSMVDATP